MNKSRWTDQMVITRLEEAANTLSRLPDKKHQQPEIPLAGYNSGMGRLRGRRNQVRLGPPSPEA